MSKFVVVGDKELPSVCHLLRLKSACIDIDYLKRRIDRMIKTVGVPPGVNPVAPDPPVRSSAATVTGGARLERAASVRRPAPYPTVTFDENRTGSARTEGFKMMHKARPSLATVHKVRGKVCVRSSRIHGYGVFALAPITSNERIVEYVGEILRRIVARNRQMALPMSQNYMFELEPGKIIDATTRGNIARFINHSCDPNCLVKIVDVQGQKKLNVIAKRPIEVNEELTIDYNFIPAAAGGRIPCFCGAAMCRQYMC